MSWVVVAALVLATAPGLAEVPDRDTPAHELDLAIEIPMLVVPAVVVAGNFLLNQPAPPQCAPLCEAAPLNDLDEGFAGLWGPDWALATDLAVAGTGALVLTGLLVEENPLAALQDAVVITEAVLWTVALGTVTKIASRRPRPFLYSEAAPLSRRTDRDAGWSFFSGHVATAAALTSATATVLARRDPGSASPWVVVAVGSALTTFVSIGRVQSGKHFPTDVVAGAAVGGLMGFLIPLMHEELEGWLVQARAGSEGAGLQVGTTF